MLILGRARHNIATIIAIATFVVIALSGVVVISGLIARVKKLEADLTKTHATIAELTASQSRLSARVDMADRSIKSLRSDLDHPQPRLLASTAFQPPR
jgi:cell division protein FtsB